MARSKQTVKFFYVTLTVAVCLYTLLWTHHAHQREQHGSVNSGPPTSGAVSRRAMIKIQPLGSNKRTNQTIHPSASVQDMYSRNISLVSNVTDKRDTRHLIAKELDKRVLSRTDAGKEKEGFPRYFRPKIQGPDRTLLLRTLVAFDKLMTENGMTYFLYGGSLVGSVRHHGLIPWDDDADVIVSSSHRTQLHRLLKALEPDTFVRRYLIHFWKIYLMDRKVVPFNPRMWPFVDIFFYDQNSTHIWDVAPQYRNSFTFPKSAIFPPRRRPFSGLSLLAPKDPQAVLARNFNISECHSGAYDHRLEGLIRSESVPCSTLERVYPFVRRLSVNGGCNETLWSGGKIVGVFFDWGVSC